MGRGASKGDVAVALRAPRGSVHAARPGVVNVEELRELCERYGMSLTPALAENRFYHVTCREHLVEIAAHGLRPGVEVDRRNFDDLPRDEQCVYLWPSVGIAQSYAWQHTDRFEPTQRVILQIEGVDLDRLCPDQEEFAGRWMHSDDELDFDPGVWALLQRARTELGADAPAIGAPIAFEQATAMIRRLAPLTRALLANACMLDGGAVMVRQSVTPGTLDEVELNDYERLSELYQETHPEPDVDYEDPDYARIVDAYHDAEQDWMVEQLGPDAEVIDADTLREQLHDQAALELNTEIRYYTARPLRAGAAA